MRTVHSISVDVAMLCFIFLIVCIVFRMLLNDLPLEKIDFVDTFLDINHVLEVCYLRTRTISNHLFIFYCLDISEC